MWSRRQKLMVIGPAAIVGLTVFAFIGGEIVKLLWNWLVPPLFGWREVTFWQALGLLALSRILVGGFGLHGGARGRGGRPFARVADRVADRVGDRWDAMTLEERERFRQRVRERCGFDPSGGGTAGPR